MKPLIVLIATFIIALITLRITKKEIDFVKSARIAMAALLCFTAIGHFMFTKGMAMMVPPIFPFKTGLVYLTGILEMVMAFGLLIPQTRLLTAWSLIIFFVLMLPANIYASFNNVNYQEASFDGNGPFYLLFRIPLQILFIIWVYQSAIKGID